MTYKSTPITFRASRSVLKSNQDLIEGAAAIGASKKFKDHSEGMAEKFEGNQGGSAGNAVEVETSDGDDTTTTTPPEENSEGDSGGNGDNGDEDTSTTSQSKGAVDPV